ncbi:MAG: thiolase C-terminal domain-containing protein, partial [Candidatus Hodarchaeales archaeon]
SELPNLLLEAAEKAIGTIPQAEIDAIFVGSMNPDEFADVSSLPAFLADELGLIPKPAVRIDNSSATGSATLFQAYMGVKSGFFNTVLCVTGEKMTNVSTAKAGRILARVLAAKERRLGLTMPALASLACRAYMHRYNLSRDQLSQIPVKNHQNGLENPYAHFRKEITLETVRNSRMIADPLRLYDCSPMSDGAAAVVISNKKGPVKISGIGSGTDHLALQHRESFTSSKATKNAARMAYEQSGLEPRNIDVAELHDAFSILEIIASEDVGFFPPGKGAIAAEKGDTLIEGAIPINPSGGLKARGHPVGATGLAQAIEIFWQLNNEADSRQIDGAKRGLTQNVGGFASNNLVTILEAVE